MLTAVPPAPATDAVHTFEAIALPHLPSVVRVARALARDPVEADDIVQETFLRALRYWDSFQPGTDCRRWLATICRNVFLQQRVRAEPVSSVEDEALDSLAVVGIHRQAQSVGLEDLFDRFDLGPAIRAGIEALAPPFRDVVTLYDIEGFSYDEIAELLMIPVGTVRSRLYRARRQLQEALLAHAIDSGLASAPRSAPDRP